MTFPSILQAISFSAGTWILWKVLRKLAVISPLSRVTGPAPDSWITGSLMNMLDKGGLDYHEKVTKQYGKTFMFSGLLGEKMLYTYDTKALYHILIKDQYSWELTEEFRVLAHKVFGTSLFGVARGDHRKQRRLLNPAFSAAHVRSLIPTFQSVAQRLERSLRQTVSEGQAEIDILGWMARTSLELISQSGYGYSLDSLEPNATASPCAKSLKNLLVTLSDPLITASRLILGPYLIGLFPPAVERWFVDTVPWPKLRELQEMSDILWNTSSGIIHATKTAIESGELITSGELGSGNHIMKLLLEANLEASEEEKMTDDDVISQIALDSSSSITFAAMDTTSNALSRSLHLLSINPDVQEKLRGEIIDAAAADGQELDCETLMSLPYLDAVCKETLRLYAPIPFVFRESIEDVVLPLGRPIRTVDGKEEDHLFVPKGTKIVLQLHLVNKDPEIWGPDANEWNPDRWLSPLPESVSQAKVPGAFSHMMTFLSGRRTCLGFLFAQLEMKVVLSTLLKSFTFSLTEKSIVWHFAIVVQPTTEDAEVLPTGEKKRQLPLNLVLL